MKKLVFILGTILIYSCNKSQITKSNDVNNDIIKDKSTQPQNSMQTKPITYELIKDTPIEDVIKKYPIISEETFILGKDGGFITEFRVGLLNIFTEEEIKNEEIKLKEITWEANSKENLTVWYQKNNNKWSPVYYFVWDKESEF